MLKSTLLIVSSIVGLGWISDWVLVEDKRAGFSLAFPVQPNIKQDSLDAGIGLSYTKTMTASVGDGNDARIYLANFTAYPESMDLNDKDSTGYYLCQTIIEQISGQLENSEILYNQPTSINSVPTQIASIRYGVDSSIVRMALFMHKNKLMSLQYYSPAETGMSKDAEKFFYSCKMMD
ncbi:MAG: hypothetical protein HOP11_00025 [Saprospiraceae bacterium]|nr:hypothetical protein [Saprospiraceae bacterium]